MKDFKFSILISIDNVEKIIDNSISQILNQSINFEDNIQIIFIDNNCEDESISICRKYQESYPDNIIITDESLNSALKLVEGEYVSFLNIWDKITDNTLKNVYSFFSKHEGLEMVTIPMFLLEGNNRPHELNNKFIQKDYDVIDLMEATHFVHPFLDASFIRKDIVQKYEFDEDLIIRQGSFFTNKILLDHPRYGVLRDGAKYYYIAPSEQIPININDSEDKKEYLENFIYVYCGKLIDMALEKYGSVPEFIQYLIVYEMSKIAMPKEISDVFSPEERESFIAKYREILSHFDDEVIRTTRRVNMTKKNFLVYLKKDIFDIDLDYEVYQDERPPKQMVFIRSGDYIINKLSRKALRLDYVEKKQGYLNIAGFYRSSCDLKYLKVNAVKVNEDNTREVYEGIYNDYTTYRPDIRFLDIVWEFMYNFDIHIPIKGENFRLTFEVSYSENGKSFSFEPPLRFGTYCNLSKYSHYFKSDDKIVAFIRNGITVYPYSTSNMLKNEFFSVKKIFTTSRRPQFMYSIFIRFCYLLAYPFLRNRRIWLFSDRPSHADDNAKHLFQYAIAQDDGIDKYYVVRRDVPDYKDMKKISKNVLAFQSLKNKIYYLYAEKIIVSHIIDKFAHPLAYRNKILYCGLATSDKYFLQHGVIEGDLSDRLNKPMRYLSMFLTSADLERKSIVENHCYNFDPHRVPALGLPRYDTLTNDNMEKQILLIPTWRSYIKGEESLITSEYFLRLKSIMNNEKLLKKMKETGYKLVFKLHPEMYPYAEYFESEHEEVEVSTGEHYQEFFNKSAVMITDYSTVAFDFAYLKKPLIYYQYADEYHYDKGYFDFEVLGFGDVIKTEEDLVDRIIEYIDSGCQMDEKYVNRVDSFFKFTDDKNNRKRVYEWILNDKTN